jgi:dynein heavy chain
MGKIIRGLCQANAWGCFDEFNRIDLPVLSVVAQQVQCVLVALKQHKTEFTFIDNQLTELQPGVGFFITMNPGYAGRQELPENLKVLFRGVTMMVPDRQAIMKVKLASQGYQKNDPLALKFFTLYRLCEEQLSKQRHYDFGLRNILSVLRTAGQVLRKKENLGKDEEFLFMRTLRDMNLSKLVFEDIDLFDALLGDMFPGKTPDKSKHEEVEAQLEAVIKMKGIIVWPTWVLKVIQLYETKLVRHGIMVVGPAMCGKSMCYGVMLEILTRAFSPHQELRMNPKAITAPQMFGRLEATGDWHDGVFSSLWRKAREAGLRTNKRYIWIICDGPVDAIWIENLNTVLDDNKLLTLANGDRIQMTDTMKCCFEVENLANASPATVSRAGIIYISDIVLGWKPVIESMFNAKQGEDSKIRPSDVLKLCMPALAQKIHPVYQTMMPKVEAFYTREVVIVMPTSIVHQVVNSFYYVVALGEEVGNAELLSDSLVEKIFWFSVSWAFGGMLETKDREKFDVFVRQNLKSLPEEGTIFDYKVNVKSNMWEHWKKFVAQWKYPGDDKLDFATLFIPTMDTVRMQYLISSSFNQRHAVLMIGISGTAKTVVLEQFLGLVRTNSQGGSEVQNYKKVNFSSATTTQNFYDSLDDCLDRQAASYGPKGGGRLTVFIDDINMPEINDWGDQVTNEIVRQVLEYSEVYDLKQPGAKKVIKNVQYVAAMSQPGGGKNDIPNRLKRHMSVLNCPLPEQDPIQQIFGSIFEGRYTSAKYNASIVEIASKLTAMTIDFWRQIAKRMLPTPDKFHYFFNLRDLSNICQGMMQVGMIQDSDRRGKSTPWDCVKDDVTLVRLWRHECTRVFSDKLNEGKDKEWFDVNLQECVAKNLTRELADATKEPVYFVNYLREPEIDPETGDPKEPVQKVYEASASVEQLQKVLYEFQKNFNMASKIRKLDLVLFDAAVKHICRISRILSVPRGNALLVGVGGSGKQSLTRLASFVNEMEYSQITMSKSFTLKMFFDAIREQYMLSSTKKPVAFVFTDNEIKQEVFLEYINSFLASGEISGLFGTDERDAALNEMRVVAKKDVYAKATFQDTPDWLWRYFINRVRERLHFVLCFSPVGVKFRTRARKFPGLISCCYINWFLPWPEKALLSVSEKTIKAFKMETDDKTKEGLQFLMSWIHNMMLQRSDEYFQRYRRNVYSTPKSYLSFIQSYTDVYTQKYNAIAEDAKKIGNGLKKLHQAADDVRLMKGDLQQKEVKLMQAQRETDALVKEIEIRTAEAEKKRQEVEAVKDVLSKEAAVVAKGEAEAIKDLEAAQPALEAAEGALDQIRQDDLSSLKPMLKPPPLVKRIFDGVCILLMKPMDAVYVEEVKGGMWITDSWIKSGKPFISEMAALPTLKNFGSQKKDDINEETCELLLPYLWMEDFTADKARQACGNVAGLCTWVRAMHTYINIAKIVGPKKEKLRKSQADLRVANKKKELKEAELQAVSEEVARYNASFQAENAKKMALEEDALNTKRRMDNANGLIDALGGERQRWTEQSNEFKDLIRRLVGDVAMSCAFIAYCGPFNSEFRSLLLNNYFINRCKQLKIPVTDNLSIVKFLVDDTTVGEWQLEGLPTDDHSIQNAIMITKSSKFPLMVDPQGQGLSWIKNRSEKKMKQREKEKGELGKVVVCQLNDKPFTFQIVAQMANGWPMIIENTPEEVDPLMDPVLEKQVSRNSRIPKLFFNDTECDFNDEFELFLATKLPNPHFIPELYAKCTIIDFTVTIAGLEQQLLGQVVGREKSELNEESAKLAEEINDNEKRRKDLEDRLLKQLSESQGNLIDDLSLIQTLQETKDASAEIKEKLTIATETRKRITLACEEYREVAIRGSVLYFLIVELSLVNVMYQTSLPQFLSLFDGSILNSERAQVASKRINIIIEAMTWNVFSYIIRGLFAKHKLLFGLLMACKIQIRGGKLPAVAFQTFLKGGGSMSNDKPKPFTWFKEKQWVNCVGLSESIPRAFKQLLEMIQRGEKPWREWIDSEAPEAEPVPDLNDKLEPFDRLLLVRALREDRTILAATDYVAATLGKIFAEPQQLDMERVIGETNGTMPIIFLLSQGSDPTATIETSAKKIKKKVHPVSMGQGQEGAANDCVDHAFTSGDWALLQNCHLGLPFLTMLEETLRVTKRENVHEEARLWITSEPHSLFPIGLLQMSIKLTNEPPQGIKAGLIRSYSWLSQDVLDAFRRPEWKPLLFTQCILHSIVQERRKFGPSGFCIPYEFNQGDWMASVQFLQNHLTLLGEDAKKTSVSWETIRYMVADIQYGGRITDNKDRELFTTITNYLYDARICHQEKDRGFTFCPNPPNPNVTYRYSIPLGDEIAKHREFIRETFPDTDPPDVFGMHANADITYRSIQTLDILATIMEIQPRGGGDTGGVSRTDVIKGMADNFIKQLPPKWKPDKKEKLSDRTPLSIFAGQEIDRLSVVVRVIRQTCIDLKDALDGKIIMSPVLQEAQDHLFDVRVPPSWVKVAWPALSISLWFSEVLRRLEQLDLWAKSGRPPLFWLAGFFNPQGFLTSVRQEITRGHKADNWALDKVETKTEVMKFEKNEFPDRPPDVYEKGAVYVYGMYLEGSAWDKPKQKMKESIPGDLYKELPVLQVYAASTESGKERRQDADHGGNKTKKLNKYKCAVYKYKKRTDLEWIFDVELNCEEEPWYWKLRGVALLCTTD